MIKLHKEYLPEEKNTPIIALAGNPNTGKSTIFNLLTGLKQHTGNWPGKTVLQSRGSYCFKQREYTIVDLPGTYSLLANSPDEQTARDFICFAKPEATVVVTDATCLERNLNLVLQVLEITPRLIVSLNLLDEARRKNIFVDIKALEVELGVPVIATVASKGKGIIDLQAAIKDMVEGTTAVKPRPIIYESDMERAIKEIEKRLASVVKDDSINSRWLALRLLDGDGSILERLADYYNLEDKVWAQSLLKL